MRVTFLGTGTSTGVPLIGCGCKVCASSDPRNNRMRQSIWIQHEGASILIDTSSDFRQQALRFKIRRIDAILYTHHHADHIFGLDDTRVFAYRQRAAIPIFGTAETLDGIEKTFWYAFADIPEGGGRPKVLPVSIDGPFDCFGLHIVPLEGDHGSMPVTGYRMDGFAYLTDCKRVPPSTLESLGSLDVLVINALRYSPEHPTHMTVGEALAVVEAVRPRRTFLIHMGHELEYSELAGALPPGVEPAYDGLGLDIKHQKENVK